MPEHHFSKQGAHGRTATWKASIVAFEMSVFRVKNSRHCTKLKKSLAGGDPPITIVAHTVR